MNAYLDASVLLRIVLCQPKPLDLGVVRLSIASRLVEVECLRTLDCARVRGDLTGAKLAAAQTAVGSLLATASFVDITRAALQRAAQPLSTQLRTLDAVHLATALMWRESTGESLTMATHDVALAAAARAYGLPVIGA